MRPLPYSSLRPGLLAAALTLLTGTALAGGAGAPAAQAWVNPQTGSDATGQVGDPNQPFRRLQTAINQVSGAVGANGQGVVHAMPGYYSDSPTIGNGESFPINMSDRVHVRGIGAKECVIRLTGTSAQTRSAWVPLAPTGANQNLRAVINMGGVGNTVPTSLEGFTIQGGDIQVWSRPEVAQTARVSNCVFDMRSGGMDGLIGPSFGVLLTPVYDFTNGGIYQPMDFHILNNTFIQGWQVSGQAGNTENALASNVAICNVNDPAFGATDFDPNPILRGVSRLNIQNNLIRGLPSARRTSLLGIDGGDTTVAFGTNPGPSNGFDSTTVGGTDLSGTYTSAILGVPPLPAVNLVNQDPGFVGEMISQTQQLSLENPTVRDWRLMPTSVCVDQGSAPTGAVGGNGALIATNGLGYTDATAPSNACAFDWDGDGHGNPRSRGADIDLGFDETDLMTIAGCYGNDTKSHGNTWHPTLPSGNSTRTYLFAGLSQVTLYFNTRSYQPGVGYTLPPGSTPGLAAGGLGLLYVAPALSIANLGLSTPRTWVNPVDGQAHAFTDIRTVFNDFGPALFPLHLNTQGFVTTAAGSTLSNLQFEIL